MMTANEKKALRTSKKADADLRADVIAALGWTAEDPSDRYLASTSRLLSVLASKDAAKARDLAERSAKNAADFLAALAA